MEDRQDTETTALVETVRSKRKAKKPSTRRKAAVLVSAVAVQAITNSLIFSLPVFYAELIQVFESKRADAALIQSLFSGICTGGGFLWSRIIKRFGPGLCTIVGATIGAVFIAVNFGATDLSMIIVTVGVIAGLFICCAYLVPFICVSWTFRDPEVPLVIVTAGSSLGQFFGSYLTEIFIQEYRWNGAFLMLAGVALQNIPFAVILYGSEEYFDKGTTEISTTKRSKCPFDISLFKDVVISFLLMNCFLLALTGNVEAWFMVDIIASRGFGRERGSLIVSLIGLAMFCGRAFGIFIRFKCRGPSIYHWMYIPTAVGICHAIIINLYDYWATLGMCIICGTFFGMTTSLTATIMFEASGLERYPQGMALVNLMYGTGNFFAGILGGFIRDTYGDYVPMFYLALASSLYINVTSMVVVCIMRGRKRKCATNSSIKYNILEGGNKTIRIDK